MATIRDLEKYLEERIPRSLSLQGDPDGTALCPDYDKELKTVVVALDVTLESIAFAKECGAQALVTHHPSIYSPLTAITPDNVVGKRMIAAIQAGLSLMSYHTRLDALEDGVNDMLCQTLGLKPTGSFAEGLGRTAELSEDYGFEDFCEYIKFALGTKNVMGISGGRPVRKLAILGGSGKGSFESAVATGADTFLTGEVPHSVLLDARDRGVNVICATHYRTEHLVCCTLIKLIKEQFPEVTVIGYDDPQL